MNDHQRHIAKQCKEGAEQNTLDFPTIVQQLIDAGFERYTVDFCQATATYYLPNSESVTLEATAHQTPIAEAFDSTAIQAAIKEAQTKVAGYSYVSFCQKVMAAGCAGYMVSFLGKRAVYFGRTGETHTELFPQ